MFNSLESHLDTVWEVIHQWEEDCLGSRTGRGHTDGENDSEYEQEYDDVCHAMARIREIAGESESDYQGWTSYATWKVALEYFDGHSISGNDGLIDDERLAEIVKEEREDQEAFCRRHFKTKAESETWVMSCVKLWLADYLKESVITSVTDRLNPNFNDAFKDDPFIGIISGWVQSWLDDVSWMEIVENMLEGDQYFADQFDMEAVNNG
jgi:hypothetical protein